VLNKIKEFFPNNLSNYFKYVALAVLMYMPIFGHLDIQPIRIWDEARLAINAYEMFKNGNLIVTYFDGSPEMWNTKPPLLIWMQVFFMKIIGVNELAIRLPSAIAAFFTCITLLIFSRSFLKNSWLGWIATFVLITSCGYISMHATRTGDYDALLTLFTTLSGLFFFAFCETKKYRYLYLFFCFTALAVLTKSVTGLLFLPAILIYSIVQNQFIPLLKSKHTYIGLFLFLGLVIGYYVLREANNSGYIAAVQKNELGGRYLSVIEEHQQGFWYYFNNFINVQLTYWYLLIPCGIVTGLVIKNDKFNRLTLFSFLMVLTFFLVISTAKTKLEWYDVPMYPFLALIIANFIYYIFNLLQIFMWINQTLKVNVLPFLFLFMIGITPYQKIIDKTYFPKETSSDKAFYEIGYFLKEAVKGKYDVNNQYLLYDGYNAHVRFYVNILNDKGVQFSFKDWSKLVPSDVVIAYQNHVQQFVEEHYKYEKLQVYGNVVTYKIMQKINKNEHPS
jgi:4-amino-4-deoxy-L-arabinose transferase-like glycosyltransferase